MSRDGAWTYFTEPRAINHEGDHRRTYVGWIDSQGRIVVSSYDHRTQVRRRAVLQTGERVDDHNNPSLIVRPDRRLLVFYSTEQRRKLVYRISRRPEDVTAWRRPHRIRTNVRGRHGYTYPNPVWLTDEPRPLFLFWRGGSFEPTFSTSENGRSWARAKRLIDGNGQRPYLVFDSNGRDRIHIAFSDGNPNELRTSIYYMRYRNGRLRRADGTRIARLGRTPVQPSAADVVYAGGESRPPAWAYDTGVGADGMPVVLYGTFPSSTDHRYNYARWNGSRWVSHEITPSGPTIEKVKGDRYYAGGMVLDSRDASVVYLSREVLGTYQIERWVTGDGGESWRSTAVTSGSGGNYRPVSVRGPSFGSNYDLFWMHGGYSTWTDFDTSIRTRLSGP